MKRKLLFLFPLILVWLCIYSHGQLWSGVLSPSRASDWSTAGIPGDIPSASWTQCGSTIAAYNGTAATINNAIIACGTDQYVKLGAGTFNLSSGIVLKSNVVLRGSGTDLTFLVFTGPATCPIVADVCFSGSNDNQIYSSGTTVSWTGTTEGGAGAYPKGATHLTLASTTGLAAGNILWLDQADNVYADRTAGDIFVCAAGQGQCRETNQPESGGQVADRSQIQFVKVTNVAGTTVTVTPGLYMPNWSAAKTPKAWYPSAVISNAGIEDLSMDHAGSTAQSGTTFFNARESWVRGVRDLNADRNHVWLLFTYGIIVRDSYFYATRNATSTSYGIELYVASNTLVENNIFQQIVAPVTFNGGTEGNVIAYNYSINDLYRTSPGQMMGQVWFHSAGVEMNLLEGNNGAAFFGDIIHGTHNMNTAFRNRWVGFEPGKTSQLNPLILRSFSRFFNLVGNVLGSNVQTAYQLHSTATEPQRPIYQLGCCDGGGVVDDAFVASTLMRWGNWDYVDSTVKWDAAEVPSGIALYPNPVPGNQNLPASFYRATKPSWWPAAKVWPPIGPDVTGGNIANVGSHANTIPAQDCYSNVMRGPSDGTGSALTFNADSCYSASWGGGIAPPSGLRTVAH